MSEMSRSQSLSLLKGICSFTAFRRGSQLRVVFVCYAFEPEGWQEKRQERQQGHQQICHHSTLSTFEMAICFISCVTLRTAKRKRRMLFSSMPKRSCRHVFQKTLPSTSTAPSKVHKTSPKGKFLRDTKLIRSRIWSRIWSTESALVQFFLTVSCQWLVLFKTQLFEKERLVDSFPKNCRKSFRVLFSLGFQEDLRSLWGLPFFWHKPVSFKAWAEVWQEQEHHDRLGEFDWWQGNSKIDALGVPTRTHHVPWFT